ncbi:hypothetical protein PDM28_10285 [Stenotrophomonas aracearum]|jgi:hypothetical protein|uniref:Uncharacterized protein n=1 Tax=Stenotrophomonas aracearum TaxID=3003272 RepID=A0ABY9Y9Q4_9GAMM|nr:hypothetical protein [Stenotrophomonas sp. A5588]WNH47099.1 hypothetical protein PDM28_10285 [Stenotrophomonas sp. A5588]
MTASKQFLELSDFLAFSVWMQDRDTEVYSPVITLDEQIESIDDLFFRVRITTAQGFQFDGCVNGMGDVGMGIFANGKMYPVNSNFPKFSTESLAELSADDPALGLPEASSLFPLRFTTIIERDPIREFSGEIDFRRK